MTDKQTQVLLSTPIDQETLNKALAGLGALSAALEKVKAEAQDKPGGSTSSGPSFGERIGDGAKVAISKFESLGEKVKGVASDVVDFGEKSFKTLAKLGTGITLAGVGIVAASSRSFATNFAGVDPQANAQNKASADLKKAFDDLGRVASRFVTPTLEALATATEAASQFLDKTFPKGADNPVSYFFNTDIPKAEKAFADLSGAVLGFVALINRDVGNAIDTFITNLKAGVLSLREGIAKVLNGLLEAIANLANSLHQEDLAKSLRGGEDLSASGADRRDKKSGYQLQIDQGQKDLQDRISGRNKDAENFGTVLGVAIKTAQGAVEQATKDAQKNLAKPSIGKAEVDDFVAHNEAIAKLDADYQQNREDAVKVGNKALEQLQKQQTDAETTLTDSYNKDKLKSVQTFNENEAQIEKENQLKREQDLRRHELTLRELASQGDVAGFITEQKTFALDQTDQREQQDLSKQQRQRSFDAESKDRDAQYQTQLAQLHKSGQEQIDQLKQQQNDQLALMKRAHDQARTQIDRDFANQLAQLDSNLGGLQSLRNQDYARQLQSLNNFVSTQQSYLQRLYQTTPGALASGASGGAAYGGDTYNTTVNNTVGDVATQSMLNEYQDTTIAGIVQAHAISKGQSRVRSAD